MSGRASFVVAGFAGAALAGMFGLPRPAAAEDGAFSIGLAPYIWTPGINGHATVHGLDVPVNKSFTQILQESDSLIGLFGRVDARYDRLGFYIDGGFTRIGIGTQIRTGSVNAKVDTAIADFALTYRVVDWRDPGQR